MNRLINKASQRIWDWEPTTRAVIALSVLAVVMSFAASGAAIYALGKLGTQVDRIDTLQKAQTDSVLAARKQAHAACVRTMRLAPALADDYARRHIFQRKYGEMEGLRRLAEAESTIPKKCP